MFPFFQRTKNVPFSQCFFGWFLVHPDFSCQSKKHLCLLFWQLFLWNFLLLGWKLWSGHLPGKTRKTRTRMDLLTAKLETGKGERTWIDVGILGILLPKSIDRCTLPETNVAPENRPLEKEIPIGNHHFQVRTLSFREGTHSRLLFSQVLLQIVSLSPRYPINLAMMGHTPTVSLFGDPTFLWITSNRVATQPIMTQIVYHCIFHLRSSDPFFSGGS